MLNSISLNQPLEVAKNLKQYQEAGIVKFEDLLSIPVTDRLPKLVEKYGEKEIHKIITVMLTDFCNFFNVVRPMTGEQIIQCAYELIITAEEDQLSVEDLAIFFQGAKQAKYGKVYDRLDQQVIFTMLEEYRETRHQKYIQIKEEKENQYKVLGPQIRDTEDEKAIKDLFHSANLGRLTDQTQYGIKD